MEITWYGHATFAIKTDNGTVLIDPFFDGNPSAPISWKEVENCDLILLTHDHGDHLGQALQLATKHNVEIVGMFDVIRPLFDQGLPENLGVGMNIGGTVNRLGIDIQMVQALHSSVHGAPAGYIITLPDGTCIYDAGDTGLFGDMGLFAEFHDIDIAILPIGGHFTMDAKQAAYACKLLKCRTLIPQHWGTFPVLAQNTEALAKHLAELAPDTDLNILKIGEPRTF
ncbi:metal-dependent hydrolase [Pseudodesulfovibrio sp.]|uniref:metal-dependent hydrolase n=1 Tax=unclassified Pseudodesulfovibrio TaxID=2661612 RepID=UPI003B00FF52